MMEQQKKDLTQLQTKHTTCQTDSIKQKEDVKYFKQYMQFWLKGKVDLEACLVDRETEINHMKTIVQKVEKDKQDHLVKCDAEKTRAKAKCDGAMKLLEDKYASDCSQKSEFNLNSSTPTFVEVNYNFDQKNCLKDEWTMIQYYTELNTKYESQLSLIDQKINKIYIALNPNADQTSNSSDQNQAEKTPEEDIDIGEMHKIF